MKLLSVRELEDKYKIEARKVYFLIRNNILPPVIEKDKILVSEEEIERYLKLPSKVKKAHHESFSKTLGPGLITGASDDDPSGIGTYSMVGARYGLALSWLSLYTLPLMTAVQETCARIGLVTGKGLTKVIAAKYGKKVIFPLVIGLVIANTVNIGANIGAMAASLNLLFPTNYYLAELFFVLIIIFLELKFSYRRYAKILRFLTLSVLAYVLTGFIVSPDWPEVFRNLTLPQITLTTGYLVAIVAVLGTTISPYLFFWQASLEVEDEKDKENYVWQPHHAIALKHEIKSMRKDVFFGMLLSNLVFLFIIITTATVLFQNGIFEIDSAEKAAEALKPLAGEQAYLLFALGIIGTGLLAVPVLAGASAYAVAELFRWHEGFREKYSHAKGFYGVIILSMAVGFLLNLSGINPIKGLYLAAIINGLVAPFVLFYIFRIARDKQIMKGFVSPRGIDLLGRFTVLAMSLSALLLIIFAIKEYL